MAVPSGIPRRLVLAMAALVGCSPTAPIRQPEHSSAKFLNSGTTAKLSDRERADVQFALGRSLEEDPKKLAEAEAAYREVLKNDRRRGDAHARLAVLCDRRGDLKASAHHFAEALRLDPRNPDVLCDQGYSLYVQRRWGDAERSLRKALAIDGSHARSHNNLGLVLARQGDEKGAVAEFIAAGCDPPDAHTNLGLILAMEGRLDDSQRVYREALKAKPDSAAATEGLRAVTVALSGAPSGRAGKLAGQALRDDSVRQTSTELPLLPEG